jgi:hypothetical protein
MPGRHPARFRSSCPESRPSSPSHQRSAETGLQRHPDWSRRVRDSTEVQLSDAVVAGRRMPSCEVRVVLRVVVKLREGARCRSENLSSGCEESRHRAGIGPAAPRCGRSRSWGAELPLRDDLDAAQQERFKKSASETKRGNNWKEDQI